jgi:hypothetical protein
MGRLFPSAAATSTYLFPKSPSWNRSGNPYLFERSPKASSPLRIMPRLSTTTLHLIADDWQGGSWPWTDRSGCGNNAVVRGSPTKARSAAFRGRKAIATPASAGFTAAGDIISATTKRTYEVLIDEWGTGTSQEVLQRVDGSATQRMQVVFKNNQTQWGSVLFNTAAGIYLGGSGTPPGLVSSRAAILHVVLDVPSGTMVQYTNGVASFTDTSVSGTLGAPGALSLGIGGTFDQTTFTTTPFTGTFLEILRHEEALSASAIAARCQQFNLLKGY